MLRAMFIYANKIFTAVIRLHRVKVRKSTAQSHNNSDGSQKVKINVFLTKNDTTCKIMNVLEMYPH